MIGGAGFDGFVPTDAPNDLGFWSTKLLGSDADHIAGYVIASSDSGYGQFQQQDAFNMRFLL
jgi:hypothetical protein